MEVTHVYIIHILKTFLCLAIINVNYATSLIVKLVSKGITQLLKLDAKFVKNLNI